MCYLRNAADYLYPGRIADKSRLAPILPYRRRLAFFVVGCRYYVDPGVRSSVTGVGGYYAAVGCGESAGHDACTFKLAVIKVLSGSAYAQAQGEQYWCNPFHINMFLIILSRTGGCLYLFRRLSVSTESRRRSLSGSPCSRQEPYRRNCHCRTKALPACRPRR